ncbi:MAG: protocatechuate 3,4-dioxygenase subunit alpha [Pseudorhodoplanes sp.]|nr:protocatechuate 3,4-dioxygenase subunit alpha [Pseudorhodoplanes sp.]
MSGITPSQTVGPWFAYGLTPLGRYDWSDVATGNLITADVVGDRIRIEGAVTDGDGVPIHDAMIEIWQADGQGRLPARGQNGATPNTSFKGFGRAPTDAKGVFFFDTVKPGAIAGPDGKPQAPHILVALYARGLLVHLYTRIYFADEAANASDPILKLVPADRRDTLIAKKETQGGKTVYRFDIRLQGEGETVFFDV